MRKYLRAIWPDKLAGQIAVLMFAAIAIFQTVVTTTYLFSDPAWRVPIVQPSEVIANAVLAVDTAEAAQRQEVLDTIARNSPWLRLVILPDPPANAAVVEDDSPLALVARRLWPHATALAAPGDNGVVPDTFAIPLRGDGYAVVTVLEPRRSTSEYPSVAQRSWLGVPSYVWERTAALFFICVAVVTIWLTGAVVSPLVALARSAESFPHEPERAAPIAERGPREVRDLSRALNRMQNRIQSMMLSRSRALAAISHDLRTIITRMRLRTEFIGDEALKEKMLHDVELMDSMLHKNLLYLRGEQQGAERSLIDLDSVLQTIADQFADMGHTVVYKGGAHQTVYGSLTELQRLFSNLVENAVSHGTRAVISAAAPKRGFIEVEVVDDGPGIPTEQRARLVEPFARGEPARTIGATSGFGLGLSIVKSLAEKAGGRLELLDAKPHGLVARVALPAAFP